MSRSWLGGVASQRFPTTRPGWPERRFNGEDMRFQLMTIAVCTLQACGGTYDHRLATDLNDYPRPDAAGELPRGPLDGRVASYLAHALANNPELAASFERWRAATLAISERRRLPEPVVSYGFYLQSVETRVGPQRHRVGLSQVFPWPTRFSRGADAASARARALQRRFDADVLRVRRDIEVHYWRLWHVHETHRLREEHDVVLETLIETLRGRMAVGTASLADLTQVELTVTRHHDHRAQHEERARAVSARLRSLIGQPAEDQIAEVRESPPEQAPPPPEPLRARLSAHPAVETHSLHAEAAEAEADAEAALRLPRFRVSAEFIETGPAQTDGVPGSGDDALIASVGLSLPLFQGSYGDSIASAQAASRAHRFDRLHVLRTSEAQLEVTLSRLRDSHRQMQLYRTTLLPQAETVYESVLGSYQSGGSTVAAILLAQRDLLELQLALANARTEHAIGWAELRYLVGEVDP
ncbi:MAG: TolC family protein [Myxococcota bacterium]